MKASGLKTKIVAAILIILLCMSSIVGSTFALFTNNMEDGTIGINATTGRVSVDIIDENKKSLVGDVLDFQTYGQGVIYFEPGATYHTQAFTVINNGNLPVNIHMFVSVDERVGNKDFYDAFELWITTDVTKRESQVRLRDYVGRLDVGKETDTYYLVVKMKPDAGNTFKNKAYRGIGVTVYAIQGNANISDYGN